MMKQKTKQVIVLCALMILFACKSEKKVEVSDSTVVNSLQASVQVDSNQQMLDAEGPDLGMDKLPIADTTDIHLDISLSRYRSYLQAANIPDPRQGGSAMAPNTQAARVMAIMLDPSMTEEANALINELPDELLAAKIRLVDQLLKNAEYLNRAELFGEGDLVNGIAVRKGIKYAWGSKQFRKPVNPKALTKGYDRPSDCDQLITGLDCSGLICQLFIMMDDKSINVPPTNAETLRKTSNMSQYLKKYFHDSPRFSAVDRDNLDPRKIESGDIIYFHQLNSKGLKEAYHIGIALQTTFGLKFFHSSGSRNGCKTNLELGRGVTCTDLGGYLNSHKNYGVVRISIAPENKPNS